MTHAVLWDWTGFHVLPNLDGLRSRAVSVNAAGVYVGSSSDGKGFYGRDLGVTKLDYNGFVNTQPVEINDDGWFSGFWQPDAGVFLRRGFVAKAFSDEIYDLGLFPGYAESFIGGINDNRTIVGGARNVGTDYQKALIWPDGALTPQDLNLMVNLPGEIELIRGIDVNNAGQVLAEAFDPVARDFSYWVLTPVPEPAGVVVAGVMGAALVRRRRDG